MGAAEDATDIRVHKTRKTKLKKDKINTPQDAKLLTGQNELVHFIERAKTTCWYLSKSWM